MKAMIDCQVEMVEGMPQNNLCDLRVCGERVEYQKMQVEKNKAGLSSQKQVKVNSKGVVLMMLMLLVQVIEEGKRNWSLSHCN